jgi:hypothetical protein
VGTPAALLAAVEPSLRAADLNLLTTGAAIHFNDLQVKGLIGASGRA